MTLPPAWATEPTPTPAAGSSLHGSSGFGSELQSQGSSLTGSVSNVSGNSSGLTGFETEFGAALRLSADVLFDFDKSDLKPGAMPILQSVVDAIRTKNPKQVQIHGHTDSKGNDAYNQTLSRKRADSVAVWLQQQGIGADIMAIAGFGETVPVAPNEKPDGSDDPDGRLKNRRVDILLANARIALKPLTPLQ